MQTQQKLIDVLEKHLPVLPFNLYEIGQEICSLHERGQALGERERSIAHRLISSARKRTAI